MKDEKPCGFQLMAAVIKIALVAILAVASTAPVDADADRTIDPHPRAD
ncbi:hypothetical protein LOC51_17860 [Rubrivivax sp. JA1024]|nr:hypothetical protein [Rubrivivax sp. JA1024]